MGCTSSKLDDLPAVALCRERCTFLDDAIHQRYVLAEAHLAYIHSLKGVGFSLHRFFDRDLDISAPGPPSPVLNLPGQRKGDPLEKPSGHIHHHHAHSNSGSHLHLPTDSDSEGSLSESPLHHHLGNSSPLYNSYGGQIRYSDHETLNSSYPGGDGFVNMNYMRNKVTPSVLYEQRPMSPQTLHMGETSSSSSSYYPNQYANNQNPNSSYYSNYDYSGYGGGGGGGGGVNGFFGGSSSMAGVGGSYGGSYPPPPYPPPVGDSLEGSSSKPPPPPPPPPSSSGWEFLNPFMSFETYYTPYTPTRDSKVREEEGIPDLEDEDFQHEVVKEVYADRRSVDGGKNYAKEVVEDDEDVKGKGSDSLYQTRPNVSMENDPVQYEVHIEKKLVDNEDRSGDQGNVAAFKPQFALQGDAEVVREIQVQFDRASESGSEIAKILEVGKFPYKKNAAYQVSSKMLHAIAPSLPVVSSQPSTSKHAESSSAEKADPDLDEDLGFRSTNLSSTLQKLYLWEKKLYEEVKVEEKMRVLHERKSRKLKRLDERGAEAHKVDVTRTLVRSLSTKINIAIQVVDKISVKINTSRDEELWPQLNDFINGLTRMWKSMLECHRSQCQAIGQARRLDAVASPRHFSDARLEATLQLEHELINWTLRFSCWVGAQKGYVKALNNWLLKCLLYVPEETADGIVPFSPSRIGAPPVFVICNQWSQALDRISEKEVVDSMRDFATKVLRLWERDKQEMRDRMMHKDMEKKVKNLDREDQKIQKEIQALDKRIVLVSREGNGLLVSGHVYQSDTGKSLQLSLQHIFESMERFTANSLRAYEELLQRIEEDRRDRLAGESEKVS